MHEYAFTESLLSLALAKAGEAGAVRVTRISITLGELSGIVDECVQQYFDVLKQNTLACDAVLAFEKKPLTVKCRNCNREFAPSGQRWDCPDCREANVEIVSGRDCYLQNIEVE